LRAGGRRDVHGTANGGRELHIQLGGKVAPVSISSSQPPSHSPSADDLGGDADPSFHRGMRITFKARGASRAAPFLPEALQHLPRQLSGALCGSLMLRLACRRAHASRLVPK
jgi:hypothetical protein